MKTSALAALALTCLIVATAVGGAAKPAAAFSLGTAPTSEDRVDPMERLTAGAMFLLDVASPQDAPDCETPAAEQPGAIASGIGMPIREMPSDMAVGVAQAGERADQFVYPQATWATRKAFHDRLFVLQANTGSATTDMTEWLDAAIARAVESAPFVDDEDDRFPIVYVTNNPHRPLRADAIADLSTGTAYEKGVELSVISLCFYDPDLAELATGSYAAVPNGDELMGSVLDLIFTPFTDAEIRDLQGWR